jgi:hypothetical protein
MSYVACLPMDMQALPLSDAINAFLAGHRMAAATFGRLALNDPGFITQYRKGRRVWPETEARIRKFMSEYQPTQVAA